MFSFRTTPLDRQEDLVLRKGSLAVLCNQSAWDPERQEYLFEALYRNGRLRKVLFPADGIFGENPDNSFGELPVYASLGLDDCQFVPLHTGPSGRLSMDADVLEDVDAVIVDYQDTGSRYDSMTALLYDIFQLIHHGELPLSVYILDRENICGRWVEGTTLCPGSSEAAGIEGIPQRHGLTLGELSNLFYSEIGAKFPLHIISYMVRPAAQYLMPWSIPPRQDVPGLFTSNFYCGMVLLSGTDLSFGEGTVRPYELFGAPYMERYLREGEDAGGFSDSGVFMRRTVFTPRFGRWKDRLCFGFQMLPRPGAPYHSVAHALRIMRRLSDDGAGTDFSRLPAVLGDEVMSAYVTGSIAWNDLFEHIKLEEQKWIRKARRYMLYDEQLVRVKNPGF